MSSNHKKRKTSNKIPKIINNKPNYLNNLCKHCLQLDEKCEELIVLTDNRLLRLYDNCCSSVDSDDRPQHRINSFAIHDSDLQFCWFDEKPIEDGFELYLCGFVEPIVAEDIGQDMEESTDNSESIDGYNRSEGIAAQMIGPLQEWWFAGFDGGTHLIIGVESLYASYILCEPKTDFKQLFIKSTQKMFLTKLIIESLLKNPDLSYEDLVQSINDNNNSERRDPFSEELLLQFAPFIVEQIKSFDSAAEEDECRLSDTLVIQTLVQLSGVSVTNRAHSGSKSRPKPLVSHIRPVARIDARRAANSDTLTCSTVLVKEFFDSIFKDVIECETNDKKSKHLSNDSKLNLNQRISNKLTNELMTRKINWIGNSVYEDRYARTAYYSAVKINEQTYSLGKFAVFREPDNTLKFGRIMFMFSTGTKQKLCHFHYFCYGKETILVETAPDLLVFMTNHCADIEVTNIVHTIDICLTNREIDLNSEQTSKCGQYLCNKLYIRKSGRFEELPKEVFDYKDVKQCVNCVLNDRTDRQRIPELDEEIDETIDDSGNPTNFIKYKKLLYKNQTYFVGDCALLSDTVFDDILEYNYENWDQISDGNSSETQEEYDQRLYPERYRKAFTDYVKGLNTDLSKVLNIGFIKEIYKQTDDSNEETKLVVNVFLRPQNVFESYEDFRYSDLNLVFWSSKQFTVGVDSLRGKCRVIYTTVSPETDVYIETDLFYFNRCFNSEAKTFFTPNSDIIEMFSHTKSPNEPIDSSIKLNVLDLFAGCGGLSYGFDKLGLVAKLWAIEKDGKALESYKSNYPMAQVFQEDVNHFLDLLLKGVKYDKSGQQLPQKGDIDMILGGPPCQGFSGMNRFSSRHYSLFKNSLVVSFLSFIDFYRPKYLLFENVRNFSLFKSSMILKLMMSCLIRMGYQCQFAILQAGSYGVPQTRRRTVIIGASVGHHLPRFPEPTHVFSRRQCQLSVTIDEKKYLAFNTNNCCAQFRAITVADAISDLPELLTTDYSNPQIRQYVSANGLENTTHYQKILRKTQISKNICLSDHYCKELSELCRLRIQNIPHRTGSDWRDLPNISHTLRDGTRIERLQYLFDDIKNGRSIDGDMRGVCQCAQGLQCNGGDCRQENTLIPWCLVHTSNRQYQWSGLYGRLSLNGYFPTTVTNPEPISKQGRVLHPKQNRIISIRESARSQGFPDHFIFKGTVSDKYRQIGNAVPIPLSIALGKQLYSVINL